MEHLTAKESHISLKTRARLKREQILDFYLFGAETNVGTWVSEVKPD